MEFQENLLLRFTDLHDYQFNLACIIFQPELIMWTPTSEQSSVKLVTVGSILKDVGLTGDRLKIWVKSTVKRDKLPVKRPANADISLHCNGHSQIDGAWLSENCHFPKCDKIVFDKSNQIPDPRMLKQTHPDQIKYKRIWGLTWKLIRWLDKYHATVSLFISADCRYTIFPPLVEFLLYNVHIYNLHIMAEHDNVVRLF